jgi:hypothetical protein
MYPRRSPAGVLNDHPKDQFPNLLRCRSSSDLPRDSGDQPPVHSKTSPVPTDYGFGVTMRRECFQSDQTRRAITQKSLWKGSMLGLGCRSRARGRETWSGFTTERW